MGWASGSGVMNEIIEGVQGLHPSTRGTLFRVVLDAFEGADWDTIDESMGIDPVFDGVVKDKHPEWFDTEYP